MPPLTVSARSPGLNAGVCLSVSQIEPLEKIRSTSIKKRIIMTLLAIYVPVFRDEPAGLQSTTKMPRPAQGISALRFFNNVQAHHGHCLGGRACGFHIPRFQFGQAPSRCLLHKQLSGSGRARSPQIAQVHDALQREFCCRAMSAV